MGRPERPHRRARRDHPGRRAAPQPAQARRDAGALRDRRSWPRQPGRHPAPHQCTRTDAAGRDSGQAPGRRRGQAGRCREEGPHACGAGPPTHPPGNARRADHQLTRGAGRCGPVDDRPDPGRARTRREGSSCPRRARARGVAAGRPDPRRDQARPGARRPGARRARTDRAGPDRTGADRPRAHDHKRCRPHDRARQDQGHIRRAAAEHVGPERGARGPRQGLEAPRRSCRSLAHAGVRRQRRPFRPVS